MCLAWAIVPAKFPPPPGKNLYRPSSYPHPTSVLNLVDIGFPTPISQITKIEDQNSDLAINVFGWENDSVVVYRISEQPGNIKRINLLMITENDKFHMCGLNSFPDLFIPRVKIKIVNTSVNVVCMVSAEKTY